MFPRSKRLPRGDFEAVSRGRRLSSSHFSVTTSGVKKGYAVVVSKKVAPLSVKRHLLKRRVLAVLKTLPLPSALVVFPKKGATELSVPRIQQELATLLS